MLKDADGVTCWRAVIVEVPTRLNSEQRRKLEEFCRSRRRR